MQVHSMLFVGLLLLALLPNAYAETPAEIVILVPVGFVCCLTFVCKIPSFAKTCCLSANEGNIEFVSAR